MAKKAEPVRDQIEDFGQKIGGARKDTARKGVRRPKSDEPKTPAYERQFVSMQLRDGQWHLFKAPSGRGYRGGHVGSRVGGPFPSEAVANAAKPIAAVSSTHYVAYEGQDAYSIKRKTTKGGVKASEQTFKTRDEALAFMAKNVHQLLEQKTQRGFGENLLREVQVTHTERVGPKVAKGKVTPNLFMETFNPKGVEFGHWEEGPRREKLLKTSFEALHDLSRATGLHPSQLTMGGQLGLSFGARGTGGLNSGSATYHPDYGTMNFTKPHGAGSLAHEYMHALDHLLGRYDDPALAQKVANARGDQVWKTLGDANYASNRVAGYARQKELHPEVRSAVADLMKTMTTKTVTEVEAVDALQKGADYSLKETRKVLEDTRRGLTESITYRSRGNKPATPEQLARFDKHAEALLAGKGGRVPYKSVSFGAGARMKTAEIPYDHPHLRGISEVMKEVRGRSGFGDYYGSLDTVAHRVREVQDIKTRIADAKAGIGKSRDVPTDFLKEAKKLDTTRTSPYWTERHEMFARAGESWVYDKLAARGEHSPYLIAASKNTFEAAKSAIFGGLGETPKPFPEGAEREAINSKFDKLFEAIRKHNIVPASTPLPKEKPASKSRISKSTAKALGLLAPVGIATAMLAGANDAKAAGKSELAGAASEGVKAGGGLLAFSAGTAAATYGLLKAGLTAARAAPVVQAALMAGGAIHGAATAKTGERLKGAASGAWNMSLPGMVVNTVKDVGEQVKARQELNQRAAIQSFERTYKKGPKYGVTETVLVGSR